MNVILHNIKAELLCIIVNDGQADRILKYAREHGIKGGTITLGRGTVSNPLLDFIGLSDVSRKEIIYLLAEQATAFRVSDEISQRFEFHKPNHGIAFTTPVCSITGTKNIVCDLLNEGEKMEQDKYHVINVIVDKGRAEDVITAAEQAGSKGGTILNARGAGVHETSRLFAMDIEPEKEVVLILAETDASDRIIESISRALHMDEPGNGILYVQNTSRTYGLFK